MAIELSEVAKKMLNDELARGEYKSPADVVEAALRELVAKREREETVQAVRAGIADAEAGRTSSVEEVFERIGRKYPDLRTGK